MKKICTRPLALALLGALLTTGVSTASRADPANPRPKVTSQAADGTLGTAILGARVNSDGSLNIGIGATGSTVISGFTGNYEVDFNRNVTGCIYSVTPFGLKFFVDVQPRSGNPNGVFVHFQDSAGTDTNVAFYLTVNCVR